MALQKQPINISFAMGLDTKTDPNQVDIGKFLALNNMVFDTAKRLTKRNGFANVTTLPDENQTTVTTLNDNLLATGSNLFAFSQDTNQWLNKGVIQPVRLDVQPLVRVSTSQTASDSATASNGLTCVTYEDSGIAYYIVTDSNTGQQVVGRTSLGVSSTSARAFILGLYFIVTFIETVAGTPHLRYIAIPIATPLLPKPVADISSTIASLSAGYDAYSANNNLFIAYGASTGIININKLTSTLLLSPSVSIVGHTGDLISVTVDQTSTPIVWVSFFDSGTFSVSSAAFSQMLAPVLAPTLIASGVTATEITSAAQNSLNTIFYENNNNYMAPYPIANVRTDFISIASVTQTGTVTAPTVLLRSVGLASKAFISPVGKIYVIVAYGDTNQVSASTDSNQPSYFLIDSTGAIYMRLAYSNGGGYEASQVLPSVTLNNDTYYVSYLIKDFLATVNKGVNLPSGTPSNAIYTQTGVNLAKFSINTSGQHSSEIANTLHLTGGQLWMYDSVKPVEHGFQVWPENVAATTATGSGGLIAQTYFYQFTYEWTDNQGFLHRSAPSIPLMVTTTTGSSTNTLYVPTLRLTYKVSPNPVRIVGYRWSTAQQVFYQFTSITSPVINDTTIDYVTIIDSNSDAAILGQTLLYTTGGVIEDIAAPASIDSALFKNRLFLIDAEDQNLLWYSKQVIEGVPVEMSDLLTLYVAPTSGAQGSTGPLTAISAMDDKLIMFKKDAIYYLTGIGPDNTGAQNDFTDPVFITASVGCANPNSIVLMPNGLMFQSDKGIWLLGRDLSTNYIGAPVEAFNSQIVLSAESIPATNQVRFVLPNSITLVYDYFFNQWGTFSNINAISATLWQGFQTYLNEFGQIFQETPGIYTDASSPVLMSFTTSWINLAGLQGYERFYFLYLLGTYYSAFKLAVSLAYDYEDSPVQSIMVQPDNFVKPWGGESNWGADGPWGGPGNVFEARIFPQKQKCESFRITVNEIFDATLQPNNAKGLALSGMNVVAGVKRGYRTQRAAKSFG